MSFKKKLPTTALLLLFLWLSVSVYFYGQHILVYKRYPVWGKVETDEALIILKNVVVYNHEGKYLGDGIPWYWRVANNIENAKLRQVFVRVCNFYSRPYTFNTDKRTIKLQGIIAIKDKANAHDYIGNSPDIRIYGDYDVALTDIMGFRNTNQSNVFYFESEGKDIELKNNHTYKVVIKNDDTGEIIKELPFKPEWQYYTYNFFKRNSSLTNYYFEPEYMIYKFINLLKDNYQEAAASYVHFKRKDSFPWENFNHEHFSEACPDIEYYVGDYLEYENVFSADLLYFEPGVQAHKLGEEFARQTIYFIDDLGQWRIIYVTALDN